MDTWTPAELNLMVAEKINLLKTRMPETYKAIGHRASSVDAKAHACVKRALRGEPNLFYAFEQGHVVGAPFNLGYVPGKQVQDQVAAMMVNFGCARVCIWGAVQQPLNEPAINIEAGNAT